MADIEMYVKVKGAASEDAVPIINNTARVLHDWLQDAGHSLVTAKVAIECPGCGKLVNPDEGGLCGSCAREELLDRQMQDVKDGLLTPVQVLEQPTEAMV